MIRAVIFDWAGTLVDYGSQAPVFSMKDAFEQLNFHIDESQIRRDLGLTYRLHIKKLLLELVDWETDTSYYTSKRMEHMIEQIHAYFLQRMAQHSATISEPKTDLENVISFLREEGIRFATTCGYPKPLLAKLLAGTTKFGFNPKVNITPEDTRGVGQPAPAMIKKAMKKLRVRNPRSVVKVGDSLNDIREGKAAGVITIGVVDGSNLIGLSQEDFEHLSFAKQNSLRNQALQQFKAAGADYVVNNLKELTQIIKHIDKISS